MQVSNQHQWFTVQGGSVQYVSRLTADLQRHGVELRLATPIAGIKRLPDGVLVRAQGASGSCLTM